MTADPGRVVVLAPNWLGDAVMALPAIADVRRAFPKASLAAAARGGVAELFRLVPGVDEVVALEWRGRWLDQRTLRADAARLGELGADAALLLPNSFASAWLARAAGIPERWGYAADWRGPLLSRAVPRPRQSLHQGRYYQHLTTALGAAPGPLTPELRVPGDAVDAARTGLIGAGWDGRAPLVVLAAGAAYGTAKRWIPGHVARLAEGLTRDGAACVLVGSRADAATMTLVRASLPAATPLIDLTGTTTLAELAGVLVLASACVSNDSGAMHVAAAVGTPLVALFGPTREDETAPLTRAGGRAEVVSHPVWCRPCMMRECPLDHRCMTRLTPERVRRSLDPFLAGKAS